MTEIHINREKEIVSLMRETQITKCVRHLYMLIRAALFRIIHVMIRFDCIGPFIACVMFVILCETHNGNVSAI